MDNFINKKVNCKIGSMIFCGAIISSGFFPFVPVLTDYGIYPFLTLYVLSLCCFLICFAKNPFLDKVSIIILFFLLYLMLNMAVAHLNYVSINDWFRGLVPFLFLVGYLLANKLFHKGICQIYNAIWLACCFWMLRLFILSGTAIFDIFNGSLARLSYVSTDTLVPFGMVGFVLTLYHENLKKNYKVLFSFLFFFVVFVSGYRSQILLIIIVLLFFMKNNVSKKIILVFIVLVLPLTISQLPKITAYKAIAERFSNIGEEKGGVRENEMRYAISNFLDSPLLGKGLSFPVPIEVTRDINTMARFETDEVRYMHNIVGYFLMDTGLIGFAFLVIFWMKCLSKIFKYFKLLRSLNYFSGVSIAWLCLSAFFLVSASFRQVQTVFLFSIMSFVILRYSPRQVPC